jgi:hypothetical protein
VPAIGSVCASSTSCRAALAGSGWEVAGCCSSLACRAVATGPCCWPTWGWACSCWRPDLTQFNLQGLELRCGNPAPGFAGEVLAYPVQASSRDQRLGLAAHFRRNGSDLGWSGTVEPGQQRLAVPWRPSERGPQRPGAPAAAIHSPAWLVRLLDPLGSTRPPADRSRPPERARAGAGAAPDPGNGPPRRWCRRPGRRQRALARTRPPPAGGRGWPAWPGNNWPAAGERYAKRFADPKPSSLLLAPDPALPKEQALQHLLRPHRAVGRLGRQLRAPAWKPDDSRRQRPCPAGTLPDGPGPGTAVIEPLGRPPAGAQPRPAGPPAAGQRLAESPHLVQPHPGGDGWPRMGQRPQASRPAPAGSWPNSLPWGFWRASTPTWGRAWCRPPRDWC